MIKSMPGNLGMDGRPAAIFKKVKRKEHLVVGICLNQELGLSVFHTYIGDINDAHNIQN